MSSAARPRPTRSCLRIPTMPRFATATVTELSQIGLPDTLEHGDLGASSILITGAGPVFLDWSDSSISHPFFSMFRLAQDAASLLPASSAESRRRMRDAYLERREESG